MNNGGKDKNTRGKTDAVILKQLFHRTLNSPFLYNCIQRNEYMTAFQGQDDPVLKTSLKPEINVYRNLSGINTHLNIIP